MADRDVVFTWTDGEQWTKWLKSVYGVKMGSELVIIVVGHKVSVMLSRCASLMAGSG